MLCSVPRFPRCHSIIKHRQKTQKTNKPMINTEGLFGMRGNVEVYTNVRTTHTWSELRQPGYRSISTGPEIAVFPLGGFVNGLPSGE